MRSLTLALLAAFGLAAPVLAEPTTITVRVVAKDAKYIGTAMGGVHIRLRLGANGQILAEGETVGGTGDTDRLVVRPHIRDGRLSGEGDAAFTTTIDLNGPTLITLEATGPGVLSKYSMPVTVTSQAWVLPGQPVAGDGWVVEMPGLSVEPSIERANGRLTLTAKVTLMCGCPVTPGGLWDAANYVVTAEIDRFRPPGGVIGWITAKERIRIGGPDYKPVAMGYAGEASTFRAEIDDIQPDWVWFVMVTAVDKRTGNTGVSTFQLNGPGPAPAD